MDSVRNDRLSSTDLTDAPGVEPESAATPVPPSPPQPRKATHFGEEKDQLEDAQQEAPGFLSSLDGSWGGALETLEHPVAAAKASLSSARDAADVGKGIGELREGGSVKYHLGAEAELGAELERGYSAEIKRDADGYHVKLASETTVEKRVGEGEEEAGAEAKIGGKLGVEREYVFKSAQEAELAVHAYGKQVAAEAAQAMFPAGGMAGQWAISKAIGPSESDERLLAKGLKSEQLEGGVAAKVEANFGRADLGPLHASLAKAGLDVEDTRSARVEYDDRGNPRALVVEHRLAVGAEVGVGGFGEESELGRKMGSAEGEIVVAERYEVPANIDTSDCARSPARFIASHGAELQHTRQEVSVKAGGPMPDGKAFEAGLKFEGSPSDLAQSGELATLFAGHTRDAFAALSSKLDASGSFETFEVERHGGLEAKRHGFGLELGSETRKRVSEDKFGKAE